MNKPELLSTAEAAEYLGVKPHTLEIWRSTRRHHIPYVAVGRLKKYRPPDLDAWLESRTVNPEQE